MNIKYSFIKRIQKAFKIEKKQQTFLSQRGMIGNINAPEIIEEIKLQIQSNKQIFIFNERLNCVDEIQQFYLQEQNESIKPKPIGNLYYVMTQNWKK